MNPAIGRFITQDSYGGNTYDPASLHRYNYANGNPIKFFDPTGYNSDNLCTLTEGIAFEGWLQSNLIEFIPQVNITIATLITDSVEDILLIYEICYTMSNDVVKNIKANTKNNKENKISETKDNKSDSSEDIIDTPDSNPKKFRKLKGNQGYLDENGNYWKKDMLHKDHWDISNKKGKKIKEVDFNGKEIWPNGPKNKNKTP